VHHHIQTLVEMGLVNVFSGLSLNHYPPDLQPLVGLQVRARAPSQTPLLVEEMLQNFWPFKSSGRCIFKNFYQLVCPHGARKDQW
jgi:hypothetical protein